MKKVLRKSNTYLIFDLQKQITMTTSTTQYATEITSIASYAKKVGFNFETGNFDEMMVGWLEAGRKFQIFVQDNKDVFQTQVKRYL